MQSTCQPIYCPGQQLLPNLSHEIMEAQYSGSRSRHCRKSQVPNRGQGGPCRERYVSVARNFDVDIDLATTCYCRNIITNFEMRFLDQVSMTENVTLKESLAGVRDLKWRRPLVDLENIRPRHICLLVILLFYTYELPQLIYTFECCLSASRSKTTNDQRTILAMFSSNVAGPHLKDFD
jgi:hypothetical protein